MLKVGEGHVIKGVSLMVTDQTDMISADSHTFMREKNSMNAIKLQVHHLKTDDASNSSKIKDTYHFPRRVNP